MRKATVVEGANVMLTLKKCDDDDGKDECVIFTLLLPTRVARAMVTCKAQRRKGPPLKAHRRPLGVCPRPPGALFGAIFSAPPPGPPNP